MCFNIPASHFRVLLISFSNFYYFYFRCLAAPFAPDLEVGPHLFAVTHDAKLVITAGHWDFSVRVFTAKAKLLQRLTYHNGKHWITPFSLRRGVGGNLIKVAIYPGFLVDWSLIEVNYCSYFSMVSAVYAIIKYVHIRF